VDLDLLAVICREDVVHGPDVAAWVDPDCLAWWNLDSQNSLCFWTDVVIIDFLEGVNHVYVAVQTKDLFLGTSDWELASALNVPVVCQVEGTEACLGEVH